MKFKIIISNLPTRDPDYGDLVEPKQEIEIEGDLDAVKTFVKLSVDINKFNWGAVTRIDEMNSGDVNRWMIIKNSTDKTLQLGVFSFYDVDPEININAMLDVHRPNNARQALNKVLGGGVF